MRWISSATESRPGRETGCAKKVGSLTSSFLLILSFFKPYSPLPLQPTMSFVANAVAGPSRVRVARSALNVAASARHQSTSSASPSTSPSTSSPRPTGGRENDPLTPEEKAQAAMDAAAKRWRAQVRVGNRDPEVFEHNYRTWLEIVGPLFKRGKKGEKAKWLGWGMVSNSAHIV